MTTRFWLRPKWVFGHLLCLFLIVLFVNLGFWQLRRLDERRDRNALIRSRERAVPTTVAGALDRGVDAAEYRRVRIRGRWVPAETVLVRSRALNGRPGYDVLTPLVPLAGDGAVIVNRGFAPLGTGGEDAVRRAVRPTSADVEVRGIVRKSEARFRLEPADRNLDLRVVNRVDLQVLQQMTSERLAPVFVQLTASTPEPGLFPTIRPLPATDEGPHFSYAIQWFIFATVGAVGWPLLLRKTARDEARERDEAGVTD